MITPADRAVLALFGTATMTAAEVGAAGVCSPSYAFKALRRLTDEGYLAVTYYQRDPSVWMRTGKEPPPLYASVDAPIGERVIIRSAQPPRLDVLLQRIGQ